MLIVPAFFLLTGLLLLFSGKSKRKQVARCSTGGTILEISPRVAASDLSSPCGMNLLYEYEVQGKYYTGSSIDPVEVNARDAAPRLIGEAVKVFYSESNPEESTLDPVSVEAFSEILRRFGTGALILSLLTLFVELWYGSGVGEIFERYLAGTGAG